MTLTLIVVNALSCGFNLCRTIVEAAGGGDWVWPAFLTVLGAAVVAGLLNA